MDVHTGPRKSGVSQQDISRLVAANELVGLSRGVYLHLLASRDRDVGFQIAYLKFGLESAIGGFRSLSFQPC